MTQRTSANDIRVHQVWRDPKTGRRLRVTSNCDSRIAVRNCETGRLSYLPLWRFNHWLILEDTDVQASN